MSQLQTNLENLQEILDSINNLPEAESEKVEMPFEVKLVSNESTYTNWGYDWCPNQQAVVIYTYLHNNYCPSFIKCKIGTKEYNQSNNDKGFYILTAPNGAGNFYYIRNYGLEPIELTLEFNLDAPPDF